MPSRYEFTKVMRNKKGQRVYKPTLYPNIPLDDNDIFLWTTDGDRLDNLAFKYYKDPSLWWMISKANSNIDYGKVALNAGIQIRIPMNVEKTLKDLEKLNNKSVM